MTQQGSGQELPQPIKEFLATLTDEEKATLKKVHDKLQELGASDSLKAQVV